MLNLKKTAVAVLAFGSSVAFAGTMGPVCTPGNVTVPCEFQAWDIGVQALYLKTSYNSNVDYIAERTSTSSVTNLLDRDADWGWGFKLEGSYHFSTGNDVNLNWYHLGNNDESLSFSGASSVIDSGSFREVYSVDPKWDAVNLEFGQHVDFGQFKNIRFHGGVQYARIQSDSVLSGFNAAGVNEYRYSQDVRFRGFGPRAGADMSYDFGNGLAMYANSAVALLAGDSDVSSRLTVPVDAPSGLFARSGSRTMIVPELEAKLGLKYTYAMAQGDLTLDGGYMVVDYINAQTQPLTLNDSDFSVHGPYLGLKWVGSVV